jgi:hypothetical protein
LSGSAMCLMESGAEIHDCLVLDIVHTVAGGQGFRRRVLPLHRSTILEILVTALVRLIDRVYRRPSLVPEVSRCTSIPKAPGIRQVAVKALSRQE